MQYLIILILFAAVVVLAGKHYMMKKELKSIFRQLEEKRKLVTVSFIDRDIEMVAQEINVLLEQMQETCRKSNASAAALKSSIADISHDMKTPLTSVIGYLQLAKRECEEEKMRGILTICLERSRYCNELINDFFALSVLESQGCVPEITSVDLVKILCEQILANHPVFEEKKITPHFEDSGGAVVVSADVFMLNRVIQNLISNAVKYTSGDIFFRAYQEGKKGILIVSNPVDVSVDVVHIFDRFYTQDHSGSQGSGIGLYLCRQFMEAMGGSIYAETIRAESDRFCKEGDFLSVKVILNI